MACPRCVVDRVTLYSIKQLLQRESMLNPCCWLLLPPCWSWRGCYSSRAARASRATLIYEIFGGRGKSRASWHRGTPSNLGRHHGAALHWFCGCHKLWLRLTVKSFWLVTPGNGQRDCALCYLYLIEYKLPMCHAPATFGPLSQLLVLTSLQSACISLPSDNLSASIHPSHSTAKKLRISTWKELCMLPTENFS